MYVEAQRSIAESQSRANIARYQMLGELVKTGDPTTKAIAAAGLLMSGQAGQSTPQQAAAINAPASFAEPSPQFGAIFLDTEDRLLTFDGTRWVASPTVKL